jgi:hypothetical protein
MPPFNSAKFWERAFSHEVLNSHLVQAGAIHTYFCLRNWDISCRLWDHFLGASGDDYFLDPAELSFDPKFVRQTGSLLDDTARSAGESCAATSGSGCIARFDTLWVDILQADEDDPVTPDLAYGVGEIRVRLNGVLIIDKHDDGSMSYTGSYVLEIGKDWDFDGGKKPNPNFRIPGLERRLGVEVDLGFTHELQRFGAAQEFFLTGRRRYTTDGHW